jgi:hypothetical protein
LKQRSDCNVSDQRDLRSEVDKEHEPRREWAWQSRIVENL